MNERELKRKEKTVTIVHTSENIYSLQILLLLLLLLLSCNRSYTRYSQW